MDEKKSVMFTCENHSLSLALSFSLSLTHFRFLHIMYIQWNDIKVSCSDGPVLCEQRHEGSRAFCQSYSNCLDWK